jgi:hypothetical protein
MVRKAQRYCATLGNKNGDTLKAAKHIADSERLGKDDWLRLYNEMRKHRIK